MKSLSILFFVLTTPLLAQDWPQWRGPTRSGVTAAFKAPAVWPERPRQVWKIDAGIGHASPVIAGGRVFLHSRIGEKEAVTAVDLATGKQIWQQTYDAPYVINPAAAAHGKGPKSTPVVSAGRLFTFGIGGVLAAWDTKDGRQIWRKDFTREYKATSPEFGVAMSPIVAGDLLVVHVGGTNSGAIVGLQPATGGVQWTWKGDGPAYASPIVTEVAGVTQLVTQSQKYVVGLSLADGKPLWQIPFTTDYDQNAVTPVQSGGLLIYAGLSKPTTAIRISRQGTKWTAEQVWQNADVPMYMSSPVESDGYLYGLTHRNRGQFFCLDAKTGKTMWTTRGREGDNAALVVSGGLLIAATTEGELVVARANPKSFDVVKRYTIAESPVWAHPAVTASGVVIKDAESLSYWVFA